MKRDADWPAVRKAIRVRMAEMNITTTDLARKSELSPATITSLLRGKTVPQGITLRKLSDGLGWPHDRLWRAAMNGTQDAEPGPHPLTALLSGPDFARGAQLQGDVSALVRQVARELIHGLTEPERIAASSFVTKVGVEMVSPSLWWHSEP
jgi:transcriptional regulator with XRE-family HTH domain